MNKMYDVGVHEGPMFDWANAPVHEFYAVVDARSATVPDGALFLNATLATGHAQGQNRATGDPYYVQTWRYVPVLGRAQFVTARKVP